MIFLPDILLYGNGTNDIAMTSNNNCKLNIDNISTGEIFDYLKR